MGLKTHSPGLSDHSTIGDERHAVGCSRADQSRSREVTCSSTDGIAKVRRAHAAADPQCVPAAVDTDVSEPTRTEVRCEASEDRAPTPKATTNRRALVSFVGPHLPTAHCAVVDGEVG